MSGYEVHMVTTTPQYRFGIVSGCTRWVKILLIVNIALFIGISLAARIGAINLLSFYNNFGQVNTSVFGNLMVWQLITALFLHGSISHLFWNMLSLWIFGTGVEKEWGGKRFLFFYFLCGVGSSLFQFLINPTCPIPSIGSSGAVFGLLAAFGVLFREEEAHLIFTTLKVKYLVAIFIGIELYLCIMGAKDGVGHWAHISGAVIAIVYIKLNQKLLFKKASSGGKSIPSNNKGNKGKRFDKIEFD